MILNETDISKMDRYYRANLINSITGYKSINLIGTISKNGIPNLAVFSQVIHLGADPPLIGVIFRPVIKGMNTLENAEETGCFTLNHVMPDMVQKAHWTSAKWQVPEFSEVGFEEEYKKGFPAPFVKESQVKIGLHFEAKYPIKINGTYLAAGRIEILEVPDFAVGSDGFVDLLKTETVAGFGLDGYYSSGSFVRYSYAKPDKMPDPI